ncbi:glycosyltransferase [Ornithinibacillus salinisoli]|uniref:Glycosyltransferase n=1 Tax=Ornithinibacillus salinisoli TaxID=1848459 RepID=A0ABW4VZF1_9BACI
MKKDKNNRIAIITPFYPIKHRNDLFEDTKAVFYLLKEFANDNDILIIHLFMHGFKNAWRQLPKVLPLKSNYRKYLYTDDYGNNILFFEYLLLFPKTIKTFRYFSNKYASFIKQYCKEEQYKPEVGVVHFPTYYNDLMKNMDIFPKKIAVIHSFDIKNIKNGYSLVFWKKYFEEFDAIGFRSYVIKKEFEKLIGTRNNSFMSLSGIPEEYITLEVNKPNYNINENIKLMYAGRLDDNKNVARSVLALNKLGKSVPYSFTIVGDGEEKKNIENLVSNLGVSEKITFEGRVTREKTFTLMQEADIFIMVSKKETLGLVYLEAMAAGCIIIATRGQGIDGIVIDGENGFLTDSNDENAIHQTIYHVMTLNPEEQMRIRDNAKNTVNNLSDTSLSEEYYYNICSIILKDMHFNE